MGVVFIVSGLNMCSYPPFNQPQPNSHILQHIPIIAWLSRLLQYVLQPFQNLQFSSHWHNFLTPGARAMNAYRVHVIDDRVINIT